MSPFWNLPGPNRYLENVVSSLVEGKHVIMILPEPIRIKLPIPVISRELMSHGQGQVTEHDIISTNLDPLDILEKILGCPPEKGGSLNELLGWEDPPSHFIALDLSKIKDSNWESDWTDLLKKAGEHAKVNLPPPYQLLVTFSAELDLPPEDLKLSHLPWWGIIGSAEIEWATEHALLDFPPNSTGEHYWLRSLCIGLCGYDLNLIRIFVEEKPKELETAVELLTKTYIGENAFPKFRAQEGEQLSPHGSQLPHVPRSKEDRTLWQLGYLDCQSGKGRYLHSALLVAGNYDKEIHRRIWLAQIEQLLPIVERIRLSVINWLIFNLGEGWVEQLAPGIQSDERDALETEIGGLAHHVFGNNSKLKHRDFTTVKNMVRFWLNIRNGLAHGKFITLNHLDDAWESYSDFCKCCT